MLVFPELLDSFQALILRVEMQGGEEQRKLLLFYCHTAQAVQSMPGTSSAPSGNSGKAGIFPDFFPGVEQRAWDGCVGQSEEGFS